MMEYRVMAQGRPPEMMSAYPHLGMAIRSAGVHASSLRRPTWVEAWRDDHYEGQLWTSEKCVAKLMGRMIDGTYSRRDVVSVVVDRLRQDL